MKRVSLDEFDIEQLDGGGVPILFYDGKPFTGIVYQLEKDGSLGYEEEYENGYQEGWVRYYHPNGKLEQECKKHLNIMVDGTFKKWDEHGNLIFSDEP